MKRNMIKFSALLATFALIISLSASLFAYVTIDRPSHWAWGAIAIDSASASMKIPYYGTGGGDSKNDAEKYAIQYCTEANGAKCQVVVSYQQCGAYAASATSSGKGTGATQQEAENAALKACNNSDCVIVISDCNG